MPGIAATLYTNDGVVGAREEYQRWAINRARYAPEREADRWGLVNTTTGGSPSFDVCEDTAGANDFGTTTNQWAAWLPPRGPLAPNFRMSIAAAKHCRDLAETDTFQHESPSSNYYPLNSSPAQRQAAEGYTNSVSGYYENIAYGYAGSTAGYPAQGRAISNVYSALFIDTSADSRGHRQAILNASAREIGLGTYRTNRFVTPFYRTYDYDTEDFGRNSSNHFFTDTIFFDRNTNGVYDESEGVSNLEVRLWRGTNEAAWYDRTGASGSFAIPIHDLPDGQAISVELRNTGATTNVTIPLGFNLAGDITLTNGASFRPGIFIQPFGTTNVGIRNLAIETRMTDLAPSISGPVLTFPSLRRARYRLESRDSLTAGAWTVVTNLTAAANATSVILPAPSAAGLFRISLATD
jgi:uncharacterized protein YkwD